MKDDNWQAVLRDTSLIKADVKEHLTAENAYREAMMASTLPLQAQMFEEMKGRIKEDDSSVPAADGAWEYYTEYRTGEQHPHIDTGRGEIGQQLAERLVPGLGNTSPGEVHVRLQRLGRLGRPFLVVVGDVPEVRQH